MSAATRLLRLLLLCAALSAGSSSARSDGGGAGSDDDAVVGDGEAAVGVGGVGGDGRDGPALAGRGGPASDGGASSSSHLGDGGGGGGRGGAGGLSGAGGGGTIPIDPALGENSVVLITGAAGFLGAELALALRRTYAVRKLLLVDDLGVVSENESAFVPPEGKDGGKGRGGTYERWTEADLGAFEIRRQRLFRIFHELTAPSFEVDEEGGERDGGGGSRKGGRMETGAAEFVRFYRADMRPSIPEFFDFGEVPLLEGIFQSHPDITHVVHLADVPFSAQNQAIPRNKDSIKTGRMEGLLEEMRLILERAAADGNEGVRLPQFVYASSHEVYDWISTTSKPEPSQPNPPPFKEDKPITTPSSLHGTAKLIDEVLASAYHSTHGIYSVGLRFFPVYGPFNNPGNDVFDLAEYIVTKNEHGNADSTSLPYEDDIKDYVFVDDAVDAILAAMQYRPPGPDPPPAVFNVGTGKGRTLREVREALTRHFPNLAGGKDQTARAAKADEPGRVPTSSYASTTRSEELLGFQARVSLEEGLAHTMAWHRDRVYPYGKGIGNPRTNDDLSIADSLAQSRGESCSPLDYECLRGASVFPCASECGRPERCTPSAWDDVASLSRAVTTGCDAVLYTILLDESAEQIPSATAAAGEEASWFVGSDLPEDAGRRTRARCNIAFVSEGSPLVRRLRAEGEEYLDDEGDGNGGGGSLPPLLRHGFWTVLPVATPPSGSESWMHAFGGTFAIEFLPKLSPGRFFAPSVQHSVYTEPTVLIEDLPGMIQRMADGPPSSDSKTILTVLARRQGCDPARRGSECPWSRPSHNDSLQLSAYNMINVALSGDLLGGGLDPVLDTSLIAHSLQEEDSRLFRCDMYGEAAQWGASSDERAIEFIMSLHDLWSQAVVHWGGEKAWWREGGGVGNTESAAEGVSGGHEDEAKEKTADEGSGKRRLLEGSSYSIKNDYVGRWMGVLSSLETQLFSHILPSDGMGIIHLDNDGPR